NPDCVICGPRPTVTRLIDYEAFCGVGAEDARVRSDAVVSSAPMPSRADEVSVEELKAMRDQGASFVLVDVREPREWAISDLKDSVKIPLGSLPQNLEKLSKQDDIVVYCRTGARSGNAVQFLQKMGFSKAKNLVGGINLWAERIEPGMPRY